MSQVWVNSFNQVIVDGGGTPIVCATCPCNPGIPPGLYVGGGFSTPFAFLTRWDGSVWNATGYSGPAVNSIIYDGTTMYFGTILGVGVWDGTTFTFDNTLGSDVANLVQVGTSVYATYAGGVIQLFNDGTFSSVTIPGSSVLFVNGLGVDGSSLIVLGQYFDGVTYHAGYDVTLSAPYGPTNALGGAGSTLTFLGGQAFVGSNTGVMVAGNPFKLVGGTWISTDTGGLVTLCAETFGGNIYIGPTGLQVASYSGTVGWNPIAGNTFTTHWDLKVFSSFLAIAQAESAGDDQVQLWDGVTLTTISSGFDHGAAHALCWV